MNTFTLHNGDSANELKQYPDNHFSSVVTDPPYLIGFLGKDWDHEDNDLTNIFKECLRVLKPGGYLLSFSAARTYHILATMIEQSGFEIKDQLMWLYGSGFPKAQDIGKQMQKKKGVPFGKGPKPAYSTNGLARMTHSQSEPLKLKETEIHHSDVVTDPEAKEWEGYKTALKPAHEPIVMARKPTKLTYVDNTLEHGVGGLNIDGARIPYENDADKPKAQFCPNGFTGMKLAESEKSNHELCQENGSFITPSELGRYPSNVIGEVEGYQKFFFNPKISRAERHIGSDITNSRSLTEVANHFGCKDPSGGRYYQGKTIRLPNNGTVIYTHGLRHELETLFGKDVVSKAFNEDPNNKPNNHPTVKPVALMRYLVKLVTPPGGIVLDPFNGSGSTGMAALAEGNDYVGIDLDQNYIDIATKRIQTYQDQNFTVTKPEGVPDKKVFNDLFGS